MSYFKNIKISEDIATISTLNSFSANVAANTTSVGTFEEITNQTGIQFVGKYDREMIVTVEQSLDGANTTVYDTLTFLRDIGFAETIASVAPYYRISLKNTSLTQVANGSLVSAKTAVINPLPRALTQEGGLVTTIKGIYDHYGFEISGTPNEELRTVTVFRLVGTQFSTAKDTNFWAETIANSASVTVSDAICTLNTNVTAVNGSAVYQTVRSARYVAGSACRFRAQLTLSTGAANNSRKFGAFDGTNGCYFELDGTTFYVVTLKAGTPTRVASTDFNKSRILPTLTENNTYEIYYNNGGLYFAINDELMHVVSAKTTHWTNEMNLKARMSTTNSNNLQTNNTIIARNCAIHRMGLDHTQSIYKNISGAVANQVLKVGPGKLHKVMINSPGTLCSVYDNAVPNTSNPIAIIDTNKTTGLGNYFAYDIPFFNGLSVATTGGSDCTICYE